MDDSLEESACSCNDVVKVEIVNGPSLDEKIRDKFILVLAGGIATLLLEKGSSWLTNKAVERKKRKLEEAKAEQKK